jgi:hypothetical protein
MATQAEWDETQLRAARLLNDRRAAEAEEVLTDFLRLAPAPAMRREALMLRSAALEDQGKQGEAKQDLLGVLELCEGGDYSRYAAELGLGGLYSGEGDTAGAMGWYRRALATAVHGEQISAGAALRAVLAMSGPEGITGELADLWRSACRRSWAVLGLDGDPPDDLQLCVDRILRGQQRAR